MTDLVQIVSVVVALALFGLVIELVRRRLLVEEYSLVWMLGAAGLLVLACFRGILHAAARWLGVYYPPSLLLLVLLFVVFVGLMFFSVVVSAQRTLIRRLFEDTALLEEHLRTLSATVAAQQAGRTEPPSAPPDPDRSDGGGDR